MSGERTGPLTATRVIELAHIMAGPVCGLMLADLGADVIKVEKPDGDDTRRRCPTQPYDTPSTWSHASIGGGTGCGPAPATD